MLSTAVDHVAGSFYLLTDQMCYVKLVLLGQYGKWQSIMENHRYDLKGNLEHTCYHHVGHTKQELGWHIVED